MTEDLNEVWLPIPGHGAYLVSSAGRIKSVRTGRVLKPGRGRRCPYRSFRPSVNGAATTLYVHVAVLLAFHGERPAGHEALHKDGNTENNRASNLRWGTRAENAADRVAHGTACIGERNGQARLTECAVINARRLRLAGLSFGQIAHSLGVSTMTAFRAVTGQSWKHIKEQQ